MSWHLEVPSDVDPATYCEQEIQKKQANIHSWKAQYEDHKRTDPTTNEGRKEKREYSALWEEAISKEEEQLKSLRYVLPTLREAKRKGGGSTPSQGAKNANV